MPHATSDIAKPTLVISIADNGHRGARPPNLPVVGRRVPVPSPRRPKARTATAQQCRRESREAAVARGVQLAPASWATEGRRRLIACRASYRSLLDTAETIIDMETRMEQVESKLARVGQSCNTRGLERISNNAGRLETHTRSRGQSMPSHWEGMVG